MLHGRLVHVGETFTDLQILAAGLLPDPLGEL